MKRNRPDLALERMLLALERDLIDATDDEILAAAKELGMNPKMKGSSAFFGVTVLVRLSVDTELASPECAIAGYPSWRRRSIRRPRVN